MDNLNTFVFISIFLLVSVSLLRKVSFSLNILLVRDLIGKIDFAAVI